MSNYSTPIITSNNSIPSNSSNPNPNNSLMLAINNNDNQRDLINLESNHNLNELNFNSTAPLILIPNNQNNLSFNINDQYVQPPSQAQFLPQQQQQQPPSQPVVGQVPFQVLPAVNESGEGYNSNFSNFAPPLNTKANSIPSIPFSPPTNSLPLPVPPPMPINSTGTINEFNQYQFTKSPNPNQYNDIVPSNMPNQIGKTSYNSNLQMLPDSIPYNTFSQPTSQGQTQIHNPEMDFNPSINFNTPVYTTTNNNLLPPLTNPSTPGINHDTNTLNYSMIPSNNLDISHHHSNSSSLNQLGINHSSNFSISSSTSSNFSAVPAPPQTAPSSNSSSNDISASYPPMNPNFIYSFPNQAMRVGNNPHTPNNIGINSNSIKKKRRQTTTMYDMTPETAARNRCSICNKQFKRPSSLQTHLYSHTGEKLFRCPWPECGRYFSVKSNMTRHARLHERDLLKKQQELQNQQI